MLKKYQKWLTITKKTKNNSTSFKTEKGVKKEIKQEAAAIVFVKYASLPAINFTL